GCGWRTGPGQAVGTAPPIDDFGFVDLVAAVVNGGETGRVADRAVDVDQLAAVAANQMVMVVADPVFETSRRARRLDATDEPLGAEETQRVVDGLKRDRPDL